MQKKIRKRFIFLNLFILISFLLSLMIIVCCAKQYTLTLTLDTSGEARITDYRYQVEDNHLEVTDIKATDADLTLTVKPLSVGADAIEIYYTMTGQEESYELVRFYSGPLKTIFSLSTFFDFEGSAYVILLIILNLLVVTALTIFSFVDYLRRSDFGYPMVACGGVGLFCLFYFFINVFSIVEFGDDSFLNFYIRTFGGYIYQLSTFNSQFALVTAPFMVIFSLALTYSNIELIIKEGLRPVNLLGVFFGVLWLTGFTLDTLIDYNISGSLEYVALISSLTSVISILICYFECMLFSTMLSAYLASRHKPPYDRDYILILGCSIRKDGTLTPLLRGRVDAAINFAKEQIETTGKAVSFIPSGGKGSDEVISEGEAMKRYLIEQGISEEMILPEIRSANTFENFKFSKEIIEQDKKDDYNAAFATTNYHIFRGYILSKKNNLKNAQGISAKTKWYFFPNAFLREMVGLFVDKIKIHILVIAILVIMFVLMNISLFI